MPENCHSAARRSLHKNKIKQGYSFCLHNNTWLHSPEIFEKIKDGRKQMD